MGDSDGIVSICDCSWDYKEKNTKQKSEDLSCPNVV